MTNEPMSTNEPTAAQTETRKCVAMKNFFGYNLSHKPDCRYAARFDHVRQAHLDCDASEIGRANCSGHDPVYLPEAEPSAPPVREWKPDNEAMAEIVGHSVRVRLIRRIGSTAMSRLWLVSCANANEEIVYESQLRPVPSVPEQPDANYLLSESLGAGIGGMGPGTSPLAVPEQPASETAWLIYFDDPDKPIETFIGEGAEAAARGRCAQAHQAWSCHLFVLVTSESPWKAPVAQPEPAASEPTPAPIPMILTCPLCKARHIDEGEFATKVHHTHSCQSCGLTWRPAIVPTVGVQFLPGFKNEPIEDPHAGHECGDEEADRIVCELDAAIGCLEVVSPSQRSDELMGELRAAFDRLRGGAPACSAENSHRKPSSSAPTGRDPDCPYCVRQIPDERCTCVPSRNAPTVRDKPGDVAAGWVNHFEVWLGARQSRLFIETKDRFRMGNEWWAREAWHARDAEIATLNRHYSMLVAQNFDLTHQVESLKAAKEQTERERDTYRDASRVAGQGIAARDRKLSAIEKAVRMRTGDGLAHRILAIIGTEGTL